MFRRLFVFLLVIAALLPAPAGRQGALHAYSDAARPARPEASPGAPLRFIENAGQFGAGARFQVQAGGGTLWLADDGLWLTVGGPQSGVRSPESEVRSPDSGLEPQTVVNLKLSFAGANPRPRLEPFGRLDARVSYFRGSDPARWRADVPVWSGVRYRELYPGVDLELSGVGGAWAHRFTLQPGAARDALNAVRLRVEGAAGVAIDGDRLRVETAIGVVTWPLFQAAGAAGPQVVGGEVLWPFTTQDAPFAAPFRHSGDTAPNADSNELLFSSFLGGGSDDSGWSMAQDRTGAIYLSGLTTSADFPTTPGAFQAGLSMFDAFVSKINPGGTALVYSTFLGGSDVEGGRALAVDESGAVYVTGYTLSPDYPTTPGALQRTAGGLQDLFVTKLDATGTGLLYSTLLGRAGDDQGRDILLGPGGAVTVAGLTQSADFPVTAGALQPVYGGLTDGLILRLDTAGSVLAYSTFLGGADYDEVRSIARGAQGALFITGRTRSSNFPTTPGAYQPVAGGDSDAFMGRLNAAGSALVYSTYLGGNAYDFGRQIAVDAAGAAYVTGVTSSPNFPSTPGAFQAAYAGNQDAFVTKLDPTGSALVYSTFLGAGGGEAGRGLALDAAGAAYLSGWTTSVRFPTTANAFQTAKGGGEGDGFVTKLNPAGSALDYSTYFGGSGDDGAYGGIVLDATGAVVFSGYTWSPDLATTAGAFQPVFGGGNDDVFLARLAAGRATMRFTFQPGRLNDLAVPLDVSAVITNAESLAAFLETRGGAPFGSVQTVQKWRPSSQNFATWSHVNGGGDNFSIATGDYVFVNITAAGPGGVTLVGAWPAPGSVRFNLVRGTATTCALNFLSLPLDQAPIGNADQLSDAIGGVVQAKDWDAAAGRFRVWANRAGTGDNFPVTPGHPYIVCLDATAPAVWP